MYEPKTNKGLWAYGLGWAIAALIGIFILLAIVFAWRWFTAEPRGALQAREQIQSGSFRIAAYDRFFNLCAAVKADEGTIDALEQELTTKPRQSRVEQINASITALRSGRNEKIQQYNADAAKDYTVGQFRASGLPYRLDPTSEVTTCSV